MSKMGLHDPFGHLKHKFLSKERPGIKLTIWFPTIKNQESTQFSYVQVMCDIPLESSWRGLQLCFRPHLDLRSTHKVITSQSCESPNFGNFKTPIWESRDKKSFGCEPHGMERCRVYYKGEGGGFPQVWAMMNLVSPSSPMARPSTKNAPTKH
jgi:hypothetical protein